MARGRVEISIDTCKGCGLCINACPQGVLDFGKEVNVKGYLPALDLNPEKCTGCTFCALMCPDTCITVYRIKEVKANG